jgi:hypothetical protein
MARTKEYRPITIDVEPFLSIMVIVMKLISLILIVTVLRIVMYREGVAIVALPGLHFSKGSYEQPKSPSYLDCYPEKVMIYPGGQTVTWQGLQRPGNAVDQLLDRVQANAAKDYVIVMARPQSLKVYRTVRKLVEQRPIDVGMDVIDANYVVDWDAAVKALGVSKK